MNYLIIIQLLGGLFLLEGVFMLPALGFAVYYGEASAIQGLAWTIAIVLLLGGVTLALSRKAKHRFYAREGFVTVALAWISLSVLGALPFYISGEIPSFVDCIFETVSGFTTTGASILTDIEGMSRGLLYWRSFTHWLGGMGMLVFLLAILPNTRDSGYSLHLLRAESPGPAVTKLTPKIHKTATILYGIYIVMTAICFCFLFFGGMPFFDSLCITFGTAGTGGFGILGDSMASYTTYQQTVCTVFMFLFGVNFSLYYLLLLREFAAALLGEELRLYCGIMGGAILLITVNSIHCFESVGQALHHVAFTVSSIMTTTGFTTVDYTQWPQLSQTLLLTLMVAGACAGSTGGGIKVVRLLILFKSLTSELKKLLRPRSVQVVEMDKQVLEDSVVRGVNVYIVAYGALCVLSYILICSDGFSMETNLSAVLACLNNIGPGLGAVGPTGSYAGYSVGSKLVLTMDMLLGRLEIFPLLLLCSPHTWRKGA